MYEKRTLELGKGTTTWQQNKYNWSITAITYAEGYLQLSNFSRPCQLFQSFHAWIKLHIKKRFRAYLDMHSIQHLHLEQPESCSENCTIHISLMAVTHIRLQWTRIPYLKRYISSMIMVLHDTWQLRWKQQLLTFSWLQTVRWSIGPSQAQKYMLLNHKENLKFMPISNIWEIFSKGGKTRDSYHRGCRIEQLLCKKILWKCLWCHW